MAKKVDADKAIQTLDNKLRDMAYRLSGEDIDPAAVCLSICKKLKEWFSEMED